jgi:hypothetical protein
MNTTTTKIPAVTTDIFGTILTLNFANGKALEVDTLKLSADIVQQATLHGLKQKLVDAAAIGRNPDTGRSATIDDKYEAVLEVFERITTADGTWNKVREGGAATGGLLQRALIRITGKSKAEIEAYLSDKSKEEQAALRKNAKIAPVIAELQAEANKGGDDVDSDALLETLFAPATPEKKIVTIEDRRTA